MLKKLIECYKYYHCVRFLVGKLIIFQRNDKIWRRQYLENPINDIWIDLFFYLDERTNQVVIVECRREWKDGGRTSMRILYNEPLPFDREDYVPNSDADNMNFSSEITNFPDKIFTI
jgi:hypothetical protein